MGKYPEGVGSFPGLGCPQSYEWVYIPQAKTKKAKGELGFEKGNGEPRTLRGFIYDY